MADIQIDPEIYESLTTIIQDDKATGVDKNTTLTLMKFMIETNGSVFNREAAINWYDSVIPSRHPGLHYT